MQLEMSFFTIWDTGIRNIFESVNDSQNVFNFLVVQGGYFGVSYQLMLVDINGVKNRTHIVVVGDAADLGWRVPR